MDDKNIITADECMEIMKDYFDDSTTVEWNGKNLIIKGHLDFENMIGFINDVADGCCSADTGDYRPELVDFMIRAAAVSRYTNVYIIENAPDLYAFLYNTDIYDVVYDKIDKLQFHEIVKAALKKIDAIVSEKISEAGVHAQKILNEIKLLSDNMATLFGNITQEDISAITEAFSQAGNIDERVMNACMNLTQRKRDDQ